MARSKIDDLGKMLAEKLDHSKDETNKQLSELRTSVKSIEQDVGGINVTVASQHVTLEEHMKRTALNEKAWESMGSRVAPLESHVAMWSGVGKAISILGAVVGIGYGIYRIAAILLPM